MPENLDDIISKYDGDLNEEIERLRDELREMEARLEDISERLNTIEGIIYKRCPLVKNG